jgi:hypothetical protein
VRFKIIGRRRWTSTQPGGVPLKLPVPYTILHHSVTATLSKKATIEQEAAELRKIREFHIKPTSQGGRGMSDIAYCYGVFPSGRVYRLRGNNTGGHTLGYNERAIGICAIGNYESAKPTDEMVESIRRLSRRLRRRRIVKPRQHPTYGHREVGSTACPGKFLFARLDEMRG